MCWCYRLGERRWQCTISVLSKEITERGVASNIKNAKNCVAKKVLQKLEAEAL